MDVFLSYNQVEMEPNDEVHTSLVTTFNTYCYEVMSFGLKNVQVTYQRLVTIVLGHKALDNILLLNEVLYSCKKKNR